MSQERCTHSGCGRETNRSVSKDGKCLFHCEKNDWFTTDEQGNQDWNKSKDKVKTFWAAFREEWVDKKTSDFSFFIFPEFTDDADFIRNSSLRKLNEEEAKHLLVFLGARFLGRADFRNTTFTQEVFFAGAIFTQDAIFQEASFTQNTDFQKAIFMQSASFPGVTFAQDASFSEATFTYAYFSWGTFTGHTHFDETTFTLYVDFMFATFVQSADFSQAIFEGRHTFLNTGFKRKAIFNYVSYKKRGAFKHCIFEGDASFNDITTNAPILFRNVTVHGRFTVGSLGQKPVALKSLAFVDCTFEKDSNVHIGNIDTNALVLIRLRSLSSLVKLVSITVQKHFVSQDSTLSGAELNNINLKDAPIIKIAYSSLSKAIFNNVRWGDVERIEADRDTFRQLKAANEEQKNYLQANGFYMREMQEYREEIKGKEWWRQERIDFWFGDFVSRFSNDWGRPIWLFLLLSLVFYLPAFIYIHWCESNAFRRGLFDFPGLLIKASWFCLTNFSLNDFAHFINPLAREAGERYESVYGWWLLHKIIGGLIIYQIIISLRRKTRH